MSEVVKIFVGTEIKTKIALDVLSHSIISRSSLPVEIIPMIGEGWEVPKNLHQGTGFSLRRFMIPKACGFEGHAIYLDADQLVFGDIAELWGYKETMGTQYSVACTYQKDKHYSAPMPQTSVMLIDCSSSEWVPDELWQLLLKGYNYAKLMHLGFMKSPILKIPTYWNHLNTHEDTVTRLLHYTKEPEQPWYKPDHPLSNLWKMEMIKAIAAGRVLREDFVKALDLWKLPKLDHRKTQGLHPYYSKFLKEFDKQK
jgi:hypothetical protein